MNLNVEWLKECKATLEQVRQQRWPGKEALHQTAEDKGVSDSENTEDGSSFD
jgi:hypothetical protein